MKKNKYKEKFNLNKTIKIVYIVMLYFMLWYQQTFKPIPCITTALGFLLVFLIFLSALRQKDISIYFSKEFILWSIFGILLLFTGMFIAKNISLHIDSMFTYFQYLILMFCIVFVSINDKNSSFFRKSYVTLGIVCAFTTLYIMYDYGGGRVSMGPIIILIL